MVDLPLDLSIQDLQMLGVGVQVGLEDAGVGPVRGCHGPLDVGAASSASTSANPDQLDLLRRYGPFTPHLQVWAHGDPLPVVETTDSFSDLPRLTYRLDPAEIEAVRATLAEASLAGSVLVPRRPRTTRI